MWCRKTVRWVSVLNDGIPPPQHFTGSGPFLTLTSESAGLGSIAVKRIVASKLNYTYCMSVQLPAWIFIARGRTVLCWCSRWPLLRHLKRHFLLTHKEKLMESFFMSVGLGACWTFKLAFSFWFLAAGQEGFVWIKHSVDLFSHFHLLLFSSHTK